MNASPKPGDWPACGKRTWPTSSTLEPEPSRTTKPVRPARINIYGLSLNSRMSDCRGYSMERSPRKATVAMTGLLRFRHKCQKSARCSIASWKLAMSLTTQPLGRNPQKPYVLFKIRKRVRRPFVVVDGRAVAFIQKKRERTGDASARLPSLLAAGDLARRVETLKRRHQTLSP